MPELRRAGGGSIINIASQLGHMGVPLRSPYCTTKAALIHFTRILAMDHAVDNIRANTISPGFILTERSSARTGGKEKARTHQRAAASAQPSGRAGGNRGRRGSISPPTKLAFVTATDLLIDGGYVAFKGKIGPEGRPVFS